MELELTLVKHVLILLTFLSTTGGRVQLVSESAQETATAAALLVLSGSLGGGLLVGASGVLVAGAGHVLEVVHCCGYSVFFNCFLQIFLMILYEFLVIVLFVVFV